MKSMLHFPYSRVLMLGCLLFSIIGAKAQLNLTYSEIPDDLTFSSPNVRFAKDVPYDSLDTIRQAFDIFLPGNERPSGLVLYFHGGGFVGGSKAGSHQRATYFAEHNIAYAQVGYRLVGESETEGVIKCLNDAKRALQFIRYHAEELNINPDKIAVMGSSAGAGIAHWLSVRDDMTEPDSIDPINQQSTRVAAAVVFSTQASYDFEKWHSVVFERWTEAISIQAMVDYIGADYFAKIYAGNTVEDMLEDPTNIEYRQDIDMLHHISPDDPPLYVRTSTRNVHFSQPGFDILHHPFHAQAIILASINNAIEVKYKITNLEPDPDQDNTNGEEPDDFVIRHLSEINDPPHISQISDATIDEFDSLKITIEAWDDNLTDTDLTFSLDQMSLDNGMNINPTTGEFYWTPDEDQNGVYTVMIDADDGELQHSRDFEITVNEINSAPEISLIANKIVDELTTLNFSAEASDSDLPSNDLTFGLTRASYDMGMTLDSNTGAFSWTPTEGQDGVYTVVVTVNDGELRDFQDFSITVNETNEAPTLFQIEDQSVDEHLTLHFPIDAIDLDIPVNTLTFGLDQASYDLGMTIDTGSGEFSWTPGEHQDGLHTVVVSVSDGLSEDLKAFNVLVADVNEPPVINDQIEDIILQEGFSSTMIDISNAFLDADLDKLEVTATAEDQSIVDLQVSAEYLTLSEVSTGTTTVRLSAVDVYEEEVTNSFQLTVERVLHSKSPSGVPLVFANPKSDKVMISAAKSELDHLRVFDLQGRDLTSRINSLRKDDEHLELNLSSLNAGVYILKFVNHTTRILKNN